MNENITLNIGEQHLIRQWFGAVQDLNPDYLKVGDYELQKKILENIGIKVPKSVLDNAEGN